MPSALTKYVFVPALAGFTVMDAPELSNVPPQLPVYQRHDAPVPRKPPFTLMVLLLPRQTGAAGPLIEVAGTEVSLTVMVVERQALAPQLSSALTQYVVVCDGLTVIVFPVPASPVAQPVLYHLHAPPEPRVPPFRVKVTVSPLQIVDLLTVMDVAGLEVVLSLITLLAQRVVLQMPSARTNNVLVTLML